jgi:hypothetical protein
MIVLYDNSLFEVRVMSDLHPDLVVIDETS